MQNIEHQFILLWAALCTVPKTSSELTNSKLIINGIKSLFSLFDGGLPSTKFTAKKKMGIKPVTAFRTTNACW